jgi:hypothetical protein
MMKDTNNIEAIAINQLHNVLGGAGGPMLPKGTPKTPTTVNEAPLGGEVRQDHAHIHAPFENVHGPQGPMKWSVKAPWWFGGGEFNFQWGQ